ncbi:hypothetical protein O987_15605 [Comamonas testosteroni TK102]|uniref:Uncharacterized protein n=1 Tax=Comamonas testosteroni TK102 TaxID=1392005 RepID=A0A076PNC4_COMTE|nr:MULTISPECIES: hypothetical protein [Comamonas]AIJ47233.1 hypothetical protein O987_15605 [Comamonas testosteroni TK102]MPS91211.1 hypothetical protein [Comamonas sp.]
MSRIPSVSLERARSDIVDGDTVAEEERQWWVRIIFVALSAGCVVLVISLLRSFATLQDYAGAMLVSIFALLAAVLAAPSRFQDRFLRPIMIYALILEIIVNGFIIMK